MSETSKAEAAGTLGRIFAKLFESAAYGQIIVLLKGDEEGLPEIRFYFKPPGLGVCETGIGFKGGDWAKAEQAFSEKVDFAFAESVASATFEQIGATGLQQAKP